MGSTHGGAASSHAPPRRQRRRRLPAAAEPRASRRRALDDLLDLVLLDLEPNALGEQVLEQLARAFRADSGALMLYDSIGRRLVPLAQTGFEAGCERPPAVPLGKGFDGRVAVGNGVLFAPELGSLDPVCPLLASEGRSAVGAPLRVGNRMEGVIHLAWRRRRRLRDEHLAHFAELTSAVTMLVESAILRAETTSLRRQLHGLSQTLVGLQENERRELSRELHDRLGSSLSALSLNLGVIRDQAGVRGPIRKRIEDSLRLVAELGESVRDVMLSLRPPALDDFGLVAALRSEASATAARYGFIVQVEGDDVLPRPSTEVETSLFRVAQEALTNVAKHAQATRVKVVVGADAARVRVVVADDGRGFDLFAVRARARQGWGLLHMRERAAALGGQVAIDAAPGRGVTVTIECPR